ncbi:MAG TPA: response regulator transcription factor [Gaiellaceae bacterium]|nr:response regulator transcription factor [Gaiellaceae bacterium]
MKKAEKTRVFVAMENRLYGEMLREGIEREPDLVVVGEAADADSAVASAAESGAAVVLISSGLPGFAGGSASCSLRDHAPDSKVIVLADERDQRVLAEGLGCGASGYLTKDCSLAEVVDAVRGVARGDVLVPPAMLGPLLADLLERKQNHEEALLRLSRLSMRERQVLALVARGKKTAEIADILVISPETARTHVQNILTKLGVHSRLEAASFVIEHGLVAHLEEAA